MTWVMLDDKFPEHPKVLRAGPVAAWAYVRALCWSRRHLTDGFVPHEAVRELNARSSSPTLVRVGLWEEVEGGYHVHDWADYNPTKAQVIEGRVQSQRQRSEAGRARARKASRAEKGRFSATSTSGSTSDKSSETPATPLEGRSSETVGASPAVHQPQSQSQSQIGTTGTTYPSAHAQTNGKPTANESEIERLRRLEKTTSDPLMRIALTRKREHLEQVAMQTAALRVAADQDEAAP